MNDTDKKPQTLLFSATVPSWVKEISDKYQDSRCSTIDLIGNTQISIPKTIKHFKYLLSGNSKVNYVMADICKRFLSKNGRAIIFCETKREVKELYDLFNDSKCKMLHGDIKQYERERIYSDFKTGKILKVIATNVAARGLDFPDIELVIQKEPPKHIESYIHRAGRTGRAGKEGKCIVLLEKRDQHRILSLEEKGCFKFSELRDSDLKKSH